MSRVQLCQVSLVKGHALKLDGVNIFAHIHRAQTDQDQTLTGQVAVPKCLHGFSWASRAVGLALAASSLAMSRCPLSAACSLAVQPDESGLVIFAPASIRSWTIAR
ncbi:hypothetical protein HYQ46_009193 [Verticillium longisporum]|nr:hypothetical protein HYQ46_009193 [Verticillium longisporum]